MLLLNDYPFLTNYFTEALSSHKKLPQSIIFYGSDFDAQYTLSKEIARLLNCQNDKSDNCNCLNCKWIRADEHPAVLIISKLDNKPDDDDSKTVISMKQSQLIKDSLMTASEFHRVFIFCDRDNEGNIAGLNSQNFQAETSNSLLKIIEEPQSDVTFIFLTRYVDDLLSTIISRSQCFFVPAKKDLDYDYSIINDTFIEYWNFERCDIFDISQSLQKLSEEYTVKKVLDAIQKYILVILKTNPHNSNLIEHIKIIENAKKQDMLGIKSINIFDDLCLKLIH